MLRRLALALFGCATLTACAARPESASTPRLEAPPPAPEPESEPFRVLSPVERVPDFGVATTAGARFASRDLVGKEPFVIVFFATWCQICELKLPVVAAALGPHGNVPVLLVSLDDAETWDEVPRFLGRHGFHRPVVRGTTFPRFALAYDPMQTVPVVAVVGRNGYLVDYQVGYSRSHAPRLAAAVEIAVRMAPDAPPFLDSPDAEPPDL